MTTAKHLIIGKRGEDLACEYLIGQNYTILERNWHWHGGELDIIAQSPSSQIVFIEVKTLHRAGAIGDALAQITPKKRRHLIASAYAYAKKHLAQREGWRIDAIAILLAMDPPQIEHVENVLDW